MVRKSTFLKNKLCFSLSLVLLGICCTHNYVWKIPVAEIKAKCSLADYSFLDPIDFTTETPEDICRLEPGAAFYFYHIFKNRGQPIQAEQVLVAGVRRDKGFWQEQAAKALLKHLLATEQYAKLARFAGDFPLDLPDFSQPELPGKYYAEALYWQQQDKELVQYLDQYFFQPAQDKVADPELLLFKGVALFRLADPAGKALLLRLFLEEAASLLHTRVYRYLEIQQALDQFTAQEQTLLEAKYRLSLGQWQSAIPLLKAALQSFSIPVIEHSSLPKDLGSACLNAGEYAAGAGFLVQLSGQLQGAARLTALEMAARLYRKMGSYGKARPLLQQVFTSTPDPVLQDRALWYYLESFVHDPLLFLKELQQQPIRWHNPAYFADILNEVISSLTAGRHWGELASLYRFTQSGASDPVTRRLSWILGRAVTLGFLAVDAIGSSEAAARLLDPGNYLSGLDYYTFLAYWQAGQTPPLLNKQSPAAHRTTEAADPQDLLINGYFDYGLAAEALAEVKQPSAGLSRQTIIRAARQYILQQDYKACISLVMKLDFDTADEIAEKELQYLYPLAFNTQLDALTKQEGIDAPLFYALVHKESAFDPNVESTSGAVGLSQLMPRTAADMAALLHLQQPDLRDPRTNLQLGSRYFSRLGRQFENPVQALAAYNAGPGRTRTWIKQYGDLPYELFAEALPYEETRIFVQRVITAAVMYGYLYFNRDAGGTLRLFYPDLAVE